MIFSCMALQMETDVLSIFPLGYPHHRQKMFKINFEGPTKQDFLIQQFPKHVVIKHLGPNHPVHFFWDVPSISLKALYKNIKRYSFIREAVEN